MASIIRGATQRGESFIDFGGGYFAELVGGTWRVFREPDSIWEDRELFAEYDRYGNEISCVILAA
jgi:hypothetical protein